MNRKLASSVRIRAAICLLAVSALSGCLATEDYVETRLEDEGRARAEADGAAGREVEKVFAGQADFSGLGYRMEDASRRVAVAPPPPRTNWSELLGVVLGGTGVAGTLVSYGLRSMTRKRDLAVQEDDVKQTDEWVQELENRLARVEVRQPAPPAAAPGTPA